MTFGEIRSEIASKTLIDILRLRLIYNSILNTSALGGAMAEIGVYKGGSSYLIAKTDPTRHLYACDTFEGLPEENPTIDLHKKGDFNDVVFEEVKQLLNLPNISVIKGLFPDSTLHKEMYDKKYSFVHLDVDLYQPTLDCLNFFYNRLVKGGILVSDDYLWKHCPGVELAFKEFLADKEETLVDGGNFSCYFIKE